MTQCRNPRIRIDGINRERYDDSTTHDSNDIRSRVFERADVGAQS